jgi:signal transduction histidine kinase/CheY-like chemotaxis protein
MATILIIDDLSANRMVLLLLLRSQGHRVLEARDGGAGLAAAQAEHPDLVITDVLMPVMDGYQLVKELRLDPATRRIPVVFYTAHYGEHEAKALARSSGVAYVLTKPAAAEEVLQIVDHVLGGQSETTTIPADASPLTTAFDREHLRLLTDKLSEKAGDLKIANARLRALLNIGLELAAERDSRRLLRNVCASACDLFGATYVTLGILDWNDQTVEHVVNAGAEAANWIETGDQLSGILAMVVAERRTVRRDNPGGQPATLELPLLHPDVHAFLAAPVASPAHVYGWICLVGNEGRSFTEEDEDLLNALSGQIGRIYENVHLSAMTQKRAEDLVRLTDRMSLATSVAGLGVWEWDPASDAMTWDPMMCRIYGVPPVVLMPYAQWAAAVHPEDLPTIEATLQRANVEKKGSAEPVEFRILLTNGSMRTVSAVEGVVLDERANVSRLVGVTMDVTARKEAEAAAEQSRNEQLRFKDEFLSHVSHELRSPLTVIKQFTTILLGGLAGDLNEEQHQYQQIVLRNVSQLQAMISDILEVSRLETGKLTIEADSVSVSAAVTDTVDTFQFTALAKGVALSCHVPPDLPSAHADTTRLRQMLIILVENAIKFTGSGGAISIRVGLSPDDPGFLLFEVSDSGSGVSADMSERIFERLYQAPEPTQAGRKGLGLGLYICKELVTRQGGRIWVTRETHGGSTFAFTLPVSSLDIVQAIPGLPHDAAVACSSAQR